MSISTRHKLVDTARQRFYRDGFRNVGLDQILDDVGISKTAFYKHFPSKEDLMVEVLTQVDQWLQSTFRDMIRQHGGKSATDQLRSLLDVVQMVIEQDNFQGCIFVNAAMEFPLAHDPAHEAAAHNKHAIEEIIFELGERAGVADPQQMAEEIALIIEGTYITRQVTNNPETIRIARRVFESVLNAHLGENTR